MSTSFDHSCDRLFLSCRPIIEELLNDLVKFWFLTQYSYLKTALESMNDTYIIPENILNEFLCMARVNFLERDLLFFVSNHLELELNEAGSMLVATEFNDMAQDLLN